jgi:hypothetical protein
VLEISCTVFKDSKQANSRECTSTKQQYHLTQRAVYCILLSHNNIQNSQMSDTTASTIQETEEQTEQIEENDDHKKSQQECKYWSSGKCKFGEHCRFAHSTPLSPYAQLRMMSSLYSQYAPVMEYNSEYVQDGSNNPYARSTMVTPCKFFYSGKCKYGYNCRFSHLQPFTYQYGAQMYPYAYAPYGGYPIYRPSGLLSSEDEEQDDVDMESLKHNMHHSLSHFQQQFNQYKHRQDANNESVKSLNEIARALHDLSLSFAQALQTHDQEVSTASPGRNIVSYLKNLLPTLTDDDIHEIENICREKDKLNHHHLYDEVHHRSLSDSETVPKKKKSLNPRVAKKTTTASPMEQVHDYPPNSYAAALCKPRPEPHHEQNSVNKLAL